MRAVSHRDGREAGALLAGAGTADAIEATVVLLAGPGDRILTSDTGDLTRLAVRYHLQPNPRPPPAGIGGGAWPGCNS